jgi:hypothetical protein
MYLASSWIEMADVQHFPECGTDSSALGFAVAVRSAAENLATSTLAYCGRVLPDLRFVDKFIHESNSSGYPLPLILANLRGLLFPDSSVTASEYIAEVNRAAIDLFALFRQNGQYPGVSEGIRWFGRDRWQMDVSFLG